MVLNGKREESEKVFSFTERFGLGSGSKRGKRRGGNSRIYFGEKKGKKEGGKPRGRSREKERKAVVLCLAEEVFFL